MTSFIAKICLAIIMTVCLGQLCVAQECNEKGMRKFDINMAKLVTIANSGRKLPESKGQDLKIWCSDSEAYVKELEQFKVKCLKNMPKQVVGILIYAVKNAIKQYCKKDSKKLDLLIEATPCINTNDNIVTKCYTTMIDSILGAKHANDNKKIPHLCCEYAKIFPCFEQKLTKAKYCNEKHVETVSDLIRGIIGNVVDLICGDYVEGSDKCDTLGPAPRKKKSQRRSKSFGPPVLDLLASFPEL